MTATLLKKGHEYMKRKGDKNRHGIEERQRDCKKYNGKEKICTEGTLFVIKMILYLKK